TTFSELTTSGLRRAMNKHKAELGDKWQGVVLDRRNNPGGLLDQAVSVSDAFLDKGEIVSTRGRQRGSGSRFNAKPGDLAAGKPVVVLINSGSASASEIVAGALQDHRRAIVMGTKSFGKGSVQTIIPLGGRGAMRLTTARYYTPSGRSIQAKGVVPDIMVQQAKVEVLKPATRQREADLRGALDSTKKDPAKKDGAKPGDPAKDAKDGKDGAAAKDAKKKPLDFQLARALDLLRGLALFNARTAN
ncbi:MAG: S41 family peptidase, partial [Pseudomonadota bacterium]